MSNFWGFDVASTEAEQPIRNLTAGKYKLLIEGTEIGMKDPQTGKYRTITDASIAGKGLIIQINCILAEAANGFAEGWKHNLFFRPMADGDAGRIARSQFKQLAVVTECSADPDPDEFKGKLFTLELVQQKNNPEYTNIKSIRPASEYENGGVHGAPVAQPAPAAAEKTKAQPLPLSSTQPAAAQNDDEPDWL